MRKKGELSSKSHNGWPDERGAVNRISGSRSIGQGTRWETVQSRGVPVFRVKGEKLIPARLLPSAGHRRQRSLSRLTRRWNRRRFAPRRSAQVVRLRGRTQGEVSPIRTHRGNKFVGSWPR